MKEIKFEETKGPLNNTILKREGYYISFNPDSSKLDKLLFKDKYKPQDVLCETALVRGMNYYILKGDFREDYIKAIQECDDFEYCIYKVFLLNQDKLHPRSKKWGDEELQATNIFEAIKEIIDKDKR